MVSAACVELLKGSSPEELLRCSVAAGTAAITTSGTNLFYRDKYEEIYNEVISGNEAFSVKNLKINGKDLINLGFNGKKIGDTLKILLEKVIDDPELNKKEKLLDIAKSLK